ncbi:hypothetical protein V6N11_082356 [Hibiscus sabdariffa]|uniref:Uncharacterized protein n=2 Tax=Hibiscus sabdariffa TaxID=183260 RepID=A0ABR2PCT5_9ROSI
MDALVGATGLMVGKFFNFPAKADSSPAMMEYELAFPGVKTIELGTDRKSKQMKNNVLKNGEASKNQSRSVGDTSSDSRDSHMKPCLKRVVGHVEEESLKNLENA